MPVSAAACATVVGVDTLVFGISTDETSFLTQSVSFSKKKDKKEARDGCGSVVSVAYYNEVTEISIDGIGSGASLEAIGVSAVSLSLPASTIGESGSELANGTVFIEEVSEEFSNEEFSKISIKAIAYSGIGGVS
tara:strand:+ start:17459 stop:17863 length:405 start_codon:yes stop_codon:yes gene_type:complete